MQPSPLADYTPETVRDPQESAAAQLEAALATHSLTVHPMASVPPFVVGAEFEALKYSLKAVGQSIPIKVNSENVLLDGRNRLRAMSELGLDPVFETDDRDPELTIIASGRNRQMNPGQAAMVAYLQSGLQEVEAATKRKAEGVPDTSEFNVFDGRRWNPAIQSQVALILNCLADPKHNVIPHDDNGIRFDVRTSAGEWIEVRKPVTGRVRQHVANMHAVSSRSLQNSQAIHTGSLTEPFAAKLVKQVVDGTVSLDAAYQEWLKWSRETTSSSGEGEAVFDKDKETEMLDSRLDAAVKQYSVLIENGLDKEASKMASQFMLRLGAISLAAKDA
tara:strand:+ start:4710 stop:5708 length:999 start_codon:yes stop_codon:yes gene_type:complete